MLTNMTDGDDAGLGVGRTLMTASWLHAPAIGLIAWIGDAPVLWCVAVSLIASAIAEIDRMMDPVRARMSLSIALMVQVAVVTATQAGQAWQVDMHMYFFAMLAILTLLASIPAIIAGAGAVAVHHLAFNFLAPELIWPGGSDLGRTVIHAVILMAEAGALIWMVSMRQAQGARMQAAAAQSEDLAH
jgi:methyl-accepting chemotaxis protein